MEYTCPTCGNVVEAADGSVGQTHSCPRCGSENTIPPPVQPAPQPEGAPAPPAPAPPAPKSDENMWAMLCHLTALSGFVGVPFGNIIGPLLIWQIQKDKFPIVIAHGKESLNFQISVTMYAIAAGLLIFACVGFVLLPAVIVASIVFTIIATVKANNGEAYRYPLTIRFIK